MRKLARSIAFGMVMAAPMAAAGEVAVQPQMVDDRKAVIATVESVREIQARTRIDGTVTALLVKEGDLLKTGDKIAVIGDIKLGIRARGLEANVQAAEAQAGKAKIDYGRAEELFKSGYATQARLDDARTALDVATKALDAARAERKLVLQQTTEGTVAAPGPGRVLTVPVAVGSVVMNGETVATLSQENYILRMELPERHARFLKAGDPVLVGSRGSDIEPVEQMHKGAIRLIYPAIKDGRVQADVVAPDLGNYFVGERTRVYVSTGQRSALVVPQGAVYRRFGVSYVRLGQPVDGGIEILSGLHPGDVVVTP